MKKLTIQLLTIAIAVIAISATNAFAQKRIKLDKNGKAMVRATVKSYTEVEWTVMGKDFGTLSIKQTKGGKFKYELRRGSEWLSSGHTTGSNIKLKSDGKSTYSITIINEEDKARAITLSFFPEVEIH